MLPRLLSLLGTLRGCLCYATHAIPYALVTAVAFNPPDACCRACFVCLVLYKGMLCNTLCTHHSSSGIPTTTCELPRVLGTLLGWLQHPMRSPQLQHSDIHKHIAALA
eukprot:1159373-Pelagomonas_calceolata.AAC.10